MKKIKKIKALQLLFFLFLLIIITKKNRIKVCICTSGKKENKYIREFVEYYKNYGIDQLFLYDNNDPNGERFEEVISDFINNGFVKLYNWRGKKRQQLNILKHCYENNYNKFDWLIFYDIDEYINLKNYRNIKDFLNKKNFKNCQNIYLNWIIHTDNNLVFYENKSLHERFPTLEPNARKHNKNYYFPVKSILRGHIPNITIDCQHQINTNLKSCNGFGFKPKLINYSMEPDFKYYYIDHFYFKSLEEFVEKLNKGSVKTNNDLAIKLARFKRYFFMNEVNINKINYIENKTGINLSIYKKVLYKRLTKKK